MALKKTSITEECEKMGQSVFTRKPEESKRQRQTHVRYFNKRRIIMICIVILTVLIGIGIIGMEYPIYRTRYSVGDTSLYIRKDTQLFIVCDSIVDATVYEDADYIYTYELIPNSLNGCSSSLYIWDHWKSYRLQDAIEEGILSVDELISSDFIIRTAKTDVIE